MKNSGASSSDPKGKRPMAQDDLENFETDRIKRIKLDAQMLGISYEDYKVMVDEDVHLFEKQTSKDDMLNMSSRRSYPFVKHNNILVVFGEKMDISRMPMPMCSCTGIPRNCRRWGRDGWSSSCCTTAISKYPLPTYVRKSRVARLQGRKMGCNTFTKVVESLLLEGYDLDCPIDLKDHWAQ